MALNSITAKQLCTKSEFQLFTESLQKNITSLDEKSVKTRISRSRKLRDKYRQTANRQDREARGKQPPRRRNPSQGSVATRKKEQLFSESLARFEKRLEKLSSDREKPPARQAAKGPAKSAGRKTSTTKPKRRVTKKKTSASPSRDTRAVTRKRKTATAAAKKKRLKVSGAIRKQKHRSADNKRRQAGRDSK